MVFAGTPPDVEDAFPRAAWRARGDGGEGLPLAVVIAMKPQLRGRVRRNVETLLELGLRVVVISVVTRKDFYVGLTSPRLDAHFLQLTSAYTRFMAWRRRDRQRQARVRALRLDRARREHVRAAARLRHRPIMMIRRALDQPRFRVGPGPGVTPFPGWLVVVAVAALVPVALGLRAVAELERLVRRSRRPGGEPPGASRTPPSWRPGGGSVPQRRSRASATCRRWARAMLRAVRIHVWNPASRTHRRAREAILDGFGRFLQRWDRITKFFQFWRESAALAVLLAPDVVVSSDLPGLVGANRAARRLRVGHAHDCHELYLDSTGFSSLERLVLWPIERWHMRAATVVTAVNLSIADEYRRRYGVRPRVVRNCTDPPEPHQTKDIRELAGLPGDCDVVLYQGGFGEGRGLDLCVRAMTEVPDAHLVLLGYGPLEERLRQEARRLGLADRVHLVPAVPPDQLLAYTSSATVGLIPYQPVSRNNYYALPNKLFEYTSVGVPVVASDLPEIRRVVVGASCGFVYDPFDARSLSSALRQTLEAASRDRIAVAARRFGTENTWRRERRILVDGFTSALRRVAQAA